VYTYNIVAADFIYWQDIPGGDQSKILYKLYGMIKQRMYEGDHKQLMYRELMGERPRKQLNELLSNTIWYRVTDALRPNPTDTWSFSVPYFPIPETFRQLNLIACIHVPELIFGTLNSPTLTKYIMMYQKRPYICQMPESKGNLCNVHNVNLPIFQIWFHDFYHSTAGACEEIYSFLNMRARTFVKDWNKITEENIIEQFSDPTSQLNALSNLAKTNPQVDQIFRVLNDNGSLLSEKNKPPHFGGKKRKSKGKTKRKRNTKRKNKTKSKRNTKHKNKRY
jgi:hypothetical protein